MIDSVLKGTGNSRFLKSAVPAGTSWADALAMLQAGTFPIDFNGINTEGFQQVGTPLNKANLLKDATAAQIGLPPSTTPDGMFQALGNTGELHVWKKMVVTTEEIPAGYTLGTSSAKTLAKSSKNSSNSYAVFYVSSGISVDDAGNVTLNEPTTVDIWQGYSENDSGERVILGKFIQFYRASNPNAEITSDLATGVYFIPSSAEFTRDRNGKNSGYTNISACQQVNAYPKTPAGTTTTYPVSTNPNAYQEGTSAGTTIEYLGKLGDKARVQVVSYVGTGTYGADNPTSLTFDFLPKMVVIMTANLGDTNNCGNSLYEYGFLWINGMTDVSTGYQSSSSSANARICKTTLNGHTLSWYLKQTYSVYSSYQLNSTGTKYIAFAIG